MHDALSLSLFDFELPAARIAQAPARPRDASRLLVMPRAGGAWSHHHFYELPEFLASGDLLVVNRTQVIAARLQGRRPTGGQVELLLYRPVDGPLPTAHTWEGLGRPGSALQPGKVVWVGEIPLTVVARFGQMAHLRADMPLYDLLQAHGTLPLPHYMQRGDGPATTDAADYQTMFADTPGAVAAPTAALHFTPAVHDALLAKGVQVASIVLHVGPGTFLPIRDEHHADIREHHMHGEMYTVPDATQHAIRRTQRAGGRVVAVGTTSARALETWHKSGDACGESHLFIYPGYQFNVINALITNFHLPRSTLLLLVSAFAGRERIMAAYADAITRDYRFYSYGDAMLLL